MNNQPSTNNSNFPTPKFDIFNTKSNLKLPILNQNKQIRFVTHNIQGFNNITKQQLWTEHYLANNYDIISITETKLSENIWHNKNLSNSEYLFYTSNNNSTNPQNKQQSSLGTAIMI